MARARCSSGKRGRRHHENLGDGERFCGLRKRPEALLVTICDTGFCRVLCLMDCCKVLRQQSSGRSRFRDKDYQRKSVIHRFRSSPEKLGILKWRTHVHMLAGWLLFDMETSVDYYRLTLHTGFKGSPQGKRRIMLLTKVVPTLTQ